MAATQPSAYLDMVGGGQDRSSTHAFSSSSVERKALAMAALHFICVAGRGSKREGRKLVRHREG